MSYLFVSPGRCQFCHRTSEDVEQLSGRFRGHLQRMRRRVCRAREPGRGARRAPGIDPTGSFFSDSTTTGWPPLLSSQRPFFRQYEDGMGRHLVLEIAARPGTAGVAQALHELLFSGGALNTRLLGGEAVQTSS